MKPRLIILSDLWGANKSEWVEDYIVRLESTYEIKFYDCCELGEVDISDYTEENLHRQFVNSGIEKAVTSLSTLEKDKVSILAFSVGGVIAWKYALTNKNVLSLIAVSSTRLRNETEKPNAKIALYFGEQDNYRPDANWFNEMDLNMNLVPGNGHEVYKNKEFIELLFGKIGRDY